MTVGFIVFFVAVTIGGFVQGQSWQIGMNEVNVLPTLKLWNIVRGVAGGLIYASAWIQAYQIWRSYRADVVAFVKRRIRKDAATAMPSETYEAEA